MRAVAFHQLGLRGELLGRTHVAHHQEAGHVHAEVARVFDVLLRNIRLGAVSRDAHRAHAEVEGMAQVLNGADAGQQQRRELGVLDDFGDGFDPFPIGVLAEAVVEGRAGEAVAMRDFDGIDARFIQRPAICLTCSMPY